MKPGDDFGRAGLLLSATRGSPPSWQRGDSHPRGGLVGSYSSCLTNCTSPSTRTLFATSTPPVSIVWFHFSPHSRRSISVLKLNPRASSPRGRSPGLRIHSRAPPPWSCLGSPGRRPP